MIGIGILIGYWSFSTAKITYPPLFSDKNTVFKNVFNVAYAR